MGTFEPKFLSQAKAQNLPTNYTNSSMHTEINSHNYHMQTEDHHSNTLDCLLSIALLNFEIDFYKKGFYCFFSFSFFFFTLIFN